MPVKKVQVRVQSISLNNNNAPFMQPPMPGLPVSTQAAPVQTYSIALTMLNDFSNGMPISYTTDDLTGLEVGKIYDWLLTPNIVI